MGGGSIRLAEHGDFPVLMKIWGTCFGDGEESLKFIFGRLLKPENMLALTVRGELAATLSIQPFTLRSAGGECAAMYVYGVATLPEHRGKGYAAALLESAHNFCADRGAVCSALVPAGDSLFNYYNKHGYETMFMMNKASAERDEISNGQAPELRSVSAGELGAAREKHLGGGSFARWDEEYLNFIIEAGRFFGGGAFGFEYEGEFCCAVCHKEWDAVLIKELAAPKAAVDAMLRALREKFGAKRYIMYLREDVQTSYTNNLLPFGMVKWYDNKMESMMRTCGGGPAYIAHVLD